MIERGLDNNVQTSIIEHGACRIQSIGMMLRIDILPCPRRATVLAVLFGVSLFSSTQLLGCQNACAAIKLPLIQRKKNQADKIELPIFEKPSDPRSLNLSPDAVQLATTLDLMSKLSRLKLLQATAAQEGNSGKISMDLRQNISELKLEIIEVIEQTRLEIDFAAAEIQEEQASVEEVLTWYENERNERVDRANLWAFRTNGILWAAAEAFTVPTYKHPRLSIPSGAVGIVAGLVPSMFSEFAMRSSGGKHHERKAYPNMLCKFYDQPVIPRTDFPDSVWKHLNLCPTNSSVTRREMLLSYWEGNQNIHTLRDGVTTEKIRKITGLDQSDIDIDLLNDRASMLRDLKAAVLQMTRPLMELSMCLRGQKQIADTVEIQ